MTVDELIQNFAQALRRLVPEVERLAIPWKRPDAYDEWDSLATATYDTLVAAPLRWSIPEADWERFRLPRYDLLLESYAGHSVIEVEPGSSTETIRIFHSLETERRHFDTVAWRPVSLDGRPLDASFNTSPMASVTMALRHLRADGSVNYVTAIDVPERPAQTPAAVPLNQLDLNHNRVRSIYQLALSSDSDFQKFVLGWTIINHFFITYWERGHPPSEEPRDWDALEEFRRHPEVEAARAVVLVHTGNTPLVKPVTRRGEPVLGGSGEVLAKNLDQNQFWSTLYAIRNNVIHGSKSPAGETNEVNIRFAATQILTLVEELARRAGVELR